MKLNQSAATVVSAFGLSVAALGLWGACSASPVTSSVHGRVALDTFSAPVTSVVADAHDGSRQRVGVDAHGEFTLVLYRHKHYRIALETGAGRVPLALAGAHGSYVLSLDVKTGGAAADIGNVRHYALASLRSEDMTRHSRSLLTDPMGGDAACAGGRFEGSGEPCMVGEAQQACGDDDDDDDDGDHQCEDGIDPNGQACDGGPAANPNDDAEEGDAEERSFETIEGDVAIPQLSLTSLGCGGDDDDEDSEQEDDD